MPAFTSDDGCQSSDLCDLGFAMVVADVVVDFLVCVAYDGAMMSCNLSLKNHADGVAGVDGRTIRGTLQTGYEVGHGGG
ncbi:hypothetical protein QVD17_19046 [Tagetes erecta]|uniref:Uncharacterized protein n=1 Tax=Tagetes erecta TaxID=13708 RepID=A0AAD8NW71_TARER|nr:hypothetical protein QVD17_19046 [Tagetes erecta]